MNAYSFAARRRRRDQNSRTYKFSLFWCGLSIGRRRGVPRLREEKPFNTGDTRGAQGRACDSMLSGFYLSFLLGGSRRRYAGLASVAWVLIFVKYGAVRFASYFAVSRSSQRRPFCTMSFSPASRELESFWISGKNIFLRVPRMRATQAARRRPQFRDLDHWKISFTRAGFATTIGAIRSWTSASWSAQLLIRSIQVAKSLNSPRPRSAVRFSRRNTAATFSSRIELENNSFATFTRNRNRWSSRFLGGSYVRPDAGWLCTSREIGSRL